MEQEQEVAKIAGKNVELQIKGLRLQSRFNFSKGTPQSVSMLNSKRFL